MRNVYFNTVGVNYTTYGFAKHSQHTDILDHVLPGGFLCTGTGWPSFLHRLGYGIYSQIACRKARTAGHQGKSRRPWRSKPDYLQYFVALGAGLAYAWLMLGLCLAYARLIPPGPRREHRFGAKPCVFSIGLYVDF
jgi:hypothetical protein